MRQLFLCGACAASFCLSLLSPVQLRADTPATQSADKKGKSGEQARSNSSDGTKPTLTFGHIVLEGALPEGAQLPGLFGEIHETFESTQNRIEKAAYDNRVQGLILHIKDPKLGWGKLNSMRRTITKVRNAGKKVYAYLDDASVQEYLLATACDEVIMPESGTLLITGVRAEVSFYKNLFDMIGVQAEMLRVGEFKSAAEPFTRTDMSPEFRKEMDELLDGFYGEMKKIITESRKLTVEKAAAAIDEGPFTAKRAKELGLIDRLAYEDELNAIITDGDKSKLQVLKKYGKKKLDTDFSGFAGMVKLMELLTGVDSSSRKSYADKIAVVYAVGPINTGKSKSDLFGSDTTLGSETLIKAIRKASEDKTVKAIVLRVDSPGGSALASDLIWRELQIVKKPVVVSMGNVAASGGYYIAMGAQKIFAEPGTITGSIGVVGGKIALQKLYGKVGITTSVIQRGKNGGVLSSTTPFTDTERTAMQKLLNDIYDQFTRKAAIGRHMDHAALEKMARGRIYTGRRAKELKLIDEVGTLDDAVAAAQKLAKLDPGEKIERLQLPKPTSPLEQLFGPLDPEASTRLTASPVSAVSALLQEFVPDAAQRLQLLSVLQTLSREPALTILPFSISVQ